MIQSKYIRRGITRFGVGWARFELVEHKSLESAIGVRHIRLWEYGYRHRRRAIGEQL